MKINFTQEEVKEWVNQAKADFRSAQKVFKVNEFGLTIFLCQQAVEKSLKAVLITKKGKLIKTHDLQYLGNEVDLPDELSKECRPLTIAYIAVRYPGAGEMGNIKRRAQHFLEITKEVLMWSQKNL